MGHRRGPGVADFAAVFGLPGVRGKEIDALTEQKAQLVSHAEALGKEIADQNKAVDTRKKASDDQAAAVTTAQEAAKTAQIKANARVAAHTHAPVPAVRPDAMEWLRPSANSRKLHWRRNDLAQTCFLDAGRAGQGRPGRLLECSGAAGARRNPRGRGVPRARRTSPSSRSGSATARLPHPLRKGVRWRSTSNNLQLRRHWKQCCAATPSPAHLAHKLGWL